jgi:hypothetical protein
MRSGFRWLPVVVAAVVALACTDSTGSNGGGEVPIDSLHILRLADNSPPLATDSVSFYAVYGQQREGTISFLGGEDFLTFKVDDFSLFKAPDGSLYGPGDSVLITIKVIAPDSFFFDFKPAGLQFNPVRPAELKLEYGHAGNQVQGDLNDDNVVDSEDEEIETLLHIWIQQAAGDPFVKLAVLAELELDEIEAEIPHFSRFALAY